MEKLIESLEYIKKYCEDREDYGSCAKCEMYSSEDSKCFFRGDMIPEEWTITKPRRVEVLS